MKYTMNDVIKKRIAVRTGCGSDFDKFIKMCEEHNVRWGSGRSASEFDPRDQYRDNPDDMAIAIGNVTKGVLGHSDYHYYEDCGCEIIRVSDIVDHSTTTYRIVIECSNDVTTATMEVNGKSVKTATAKRNPVDKFNFRAGAEIAFNRLFKKKESKDSGFKVGDRVECIAEQTWNRSIVGQKGTILEVNPTDVLVEFDDDIGGHAGGWGSLVNGKPGHCWFVSFEKLRHV